MARELITRIWCDVCMDQGETNEGQETEPITIGNLKPRVLVLCEEHWPMYDEFRAAVAELGQIHDAEVRATSTKQPARKRQQSPNQVSPLQPPFVCLVPDCDSGDHEFKNRGSLQVHIRNRHGMLTGEYAEEYLTAG